MPSQHGSSAHSSNVPQSHSSSSSMTLLPQLRRNSICERGQKQTKRSNAGRILRKGVRGVNKAFSFSFTGYSQVTQLHKGPKQNSSEVFRCCQTKRISIRACSFALVTLPLSICWEMGGLSPRDCAECVPGKGKEDGVGGLGVEGWWGFCCISHLIGLVEQTKPVARTQCVNIILFAAFREFVWLHILLANDGLRHYTSVPIAAEAFLTCGTEYKTEQNRTKKRKRENQNTKYSIASRFYLLKIRYEKQFACRERTQQSMAQWKVFHMAAI